MKKIDEATLQILSRVTTEGDKIHLTCGQLDRKQYLEVNKILELMGGKWNRKEKGHIFFEDPTDRLESVLLTGEIMEPQKYGYFPTPEPLARRLIELAELKPGMTVLEPSAGQGGIVDHIPEGCAIDCMELLPNNTEVLQKKGYLVQQCDFLSIETKPIYDRVIMNPPFERQQDVDHVRHALKCLKPNGRLVSVMSAGIVFRENKKTAEFREIVDRYGFIERNPEGSFKVSGTMINTVIVGVNIETIPWQEATHD